MINCTNNCGRDCTLSVTSTILNLQKVTSITTFVLGVLGNLYVFVIFFRRPRKDWTNMMVYITNVAIADSVVLVILPVMMLYYNVQIREDFKPVCNFLLSLQYVNMYASIFTVTAICIVRYIAIKFPLKAREILSRKSALMVCALIWAFVICVSLVYYLQDSSNDKKMCFQRVKESLSLLFVLLLTIGGFLAPFLIVLYCSIRVICTLRRQLDVGFRAEKLQCMFVIAANLIVFVICFLPVHFGFVLKYTAQQLKFSCDARLFAHNFVHGAMCVSILNCGLDSFSYYFVTKTTWNMCGTNERNEDPE